jgi:2-C-methyl-D-erythritol 2,4-cyclodiphosphate synthase
MSPRIGFGFDIHRLVPGRPLLLCGVRFDHPLGLLGHSDADAPTHALMDALLGAAALGDIGHLFPDTDPEWEGADSLRLLEAVVALLRRRGWRVVNADVTILAEAPKIAPRAQEMRERLAAPLGVPVDAVSVKATTMEKLGPVGAREAIAAQAVALIESAG